MKISTTKKTEFKDLHEIFCGHNSHRVSLNYDRKELIFDITHYGNFPDSGLNSLFINYFKDIDNSFTKYLYVKKGYLESYLTSKKYQADIKEFFLEISKDFKVFTDSDIKTDSELVEVNSELMDKIQFQDSERNRYVKLVHTIYTEKRIPKHKPFTLTHSYTKPLASIEALELIEKIGVDKVKEFFRVSRQSIYLPKNATTLEHIRLLEAVGFSFYESCENLKRVKAVEIFSGLGDNLGEIA